MGGTRGGDCFMAGCYVIWNFGPTFEPVATIIVLLAEELASTSVTSRGSSEVPAPFLFRILVAGVSCGKTGLNR